MREPGVFHLPAKRPVVGQLIVLASTKQGFHACTSRLFYLSPPKVNPAAIPAEDRVFGHSTIRAASLANV